MSAAREWDSAPKGHNSGRYTFTVELLDEIIHRPRDDHPQYILTDRHHRPNRERLERLAEELNRIADSVYRLAAASRKLKSLLEEKRLGQGLPSWASSVSLEQVMYYCMGRRAAAADSGNRRFFETEERRFAEAARDMAGLLDHQSLWRPASIGWHHVAEAIAAAFKNAMQANNGMLSLSSAPVVRFVKAILPHITGEPQSHDAIAKQLKRARKRAKGPV